MYNLFFIEGKIIDLEFDVSSINSKVKKYEDDYEAAFN